MLRSAGLPVFARTASFYFRWLQPQIKSGAPKLPIHSITTVLLLAAFSGRAASQVAINEIMYHPSSRVATEEWVELYNISDSPVDLTGWSVRGGIEFSFEPGTSLSPGGFLVVAADTNSFGGKHAGVPVVGPWSGTLRNRGDLVELRDAQGELADRVDYADEGEWARRVRGPLQYGHQGWDWLAEHDGLGHTLELRNPALPNEFGGNWGSSTEAGGTPGKANSVHTTNSPPILSSPAHFPVVPKSGDTVWVRVRVADEQPHRLEVNMHYRGDGANPPPFSTVPMHDDGLHGDAAAGDGIYGAAIPPAPHNTIIEFYVSAADATGQATTCPGPARQADGSWAQTGNLLYQVDDSAGAGPFPLYKIIMIERERAELLSIGSNLSESLSDAQMNATFISIDSQGAQARYLAGVRNRGHGSRSRKPNNYRINFRSDDLWHGIEALNINAQFGFLQHAGAVLALKAGVAGAHSRPIQLRVNNQQLAFTGGHHLTYGFYVANEAMNEEWVQAHFPLDDKGNLYRGIRDLGPADFSYRGPSRDAYTNSYFKVTNEREDDWTDLIQLTQTLSETPDAEYELAVRRVIHVDQWLLHLAVMAIFDSRETGLNTGHGDDYFVYRGVQDQRFRLLFYDLDSILGEGNPLGSTNGTLFGAASLPVFNRLMNWPSFKTNYFRALDRLINTTFSPAEYSATLDATIAPYIPPSVLARMKVWMNGRREHIRLVIAPLLASPPPPQAEISSAPRGRTPSTAAQFEVRGKGVAQYRYRLNEGEWSATQSVDTPLLLEGLTPGTYQLSVLGGDAAGHWQPESEPTRSQLWTVDPSASGLRLNELLALNNLAVRHGNGYPDLLELYNEGAEPVLLSDYKLSRDPEGQSGWELPAVALPAGQYAFYSSRDLGFAFDAEGDSVYLLRAETGGWEVIDSFTFGNQLRDLSVGRFHGRDWALSTPTFGQVNAPAPVGSPEDVRINEWLAAPQSFARGEFLELFNPADLPVNLGGLRLTDQPIGEPSKHRIRDATFVPAQGFIAFRPDANSRRGDHLSFRLFGQYGEAALLNENHRIIDLVVYGTQEADRAEGRLPDGSERHVTLPRPTPGFSNSANSAPAATELITFVPWNHSWRYDESGALHAPPWTSADFNDSTWPSGPGLLAYESSLLSEPIRTPLASLGTNRVYYFRTKFQVADPLAVAALQVSYFVDDAAVFYLNGAEAGPSYNLPLGEILATTRPSSTINNARMLGPFTWPVGNLVAGENTLAMRIHQAENDTGDVVFGLRLDALVITNSPAPPAVIINEVLTQNTGVPGAGGGTPDFIELFNRSEEPADLSGFSLTDDLSAPRRFTFPQGTILEPKGFLVLSSDASIPAAFNSTGFGLQASGGALYLIAKDNLRVLDEAVYGLLPANWSIGRFGDGGVWSLMPPSLGEANPTPVRGEPHAIRINEWMASPLSGDDWFELFNPGAAPVDISGSWLSDDPAEPRKTVLPPHSWLAPKVEGYRLIFADNRPDRGADHASFQLSAEGEHILLSAADGLLIGAISFRRQTPGVSEGRSPDGAPAIAPFPDGATPGAPNFVVAEADTDGDGLPDWWEQAFGLLQDHAADALQDSDGDGLSNAAEFAAGTAPNNRWSTLQAVLRRSAEGYVLQFEAAADQGYEVQTSESLLPPSWNPWQVIQPGAARLITVPIAAPAGVAQFFRVRTFGP